MKKQVDVLYLTYDGLTDPLGQSQVLPYLSGLADLGYNVYIVSFEKRDLFQKDKVLIEKICRAHDLNWYPLLYHKSPLVISTMYDLWKMRHFSRRLLDRHAIKIVHCRSYIAAMVGLYLKKKYGVKFLFDMRGFWADERVEGGIWDLSSIVFRLVYRFFKRKEILFTSKADHIVSLTYSGKEEITSGRLFQNDLSSNVDLKKNIVRIPEEKVSVIPCCVDLALFDPAKVTDGDRVGIRKKLGLNGKTKLLTYLGSIGTWYLLDEMLKFYREMRKEQPFKFLFITNEPPKKIINSAQKYEIETSEMLIKQLPRTEVPKYLFSSDYGIFFIKPCYSKKASSATKMGEMIAMGLPIIANTGVGDGDFILNKYDCGHLVDLEKKWDLPEKKEFSGFFIASKDYFDLQKGIRKYSEIYSLIQGPHIS